MNERTGAEDIRDPRALRLMNLLIQFPMSKGDCARLLRRVAEHYEPSGMRSCDVCDRPFRPTRGTHTRCSAACRVAALRRRRVSSRYENAPMR